MTGPKEGKPAEKNSPHILLLQMKRIGDLMLVAPVVKALRRDLPGCRITIATHNISSGILPLVGADQSLVFKHPFGGIEFWQSFRKLHPDVCIDFSGTDRTVLLCALSRAGRRIGYQRFLKRPLRKLAYTETVDSPVAKRHSIDHFTDLLAPLGVECHNEPLSLDLPESCKSEVSNFLDEAGVRSPYAVVHPGTARTEKYWTPEGWATILRFLREKHGLNLVVTGSTDPTEAAHLEKIRSAGPGPFLSLAGKLDLMQLAGVVARARILVGVDSAPGHLGDGLDVPSVVLFGPTNPLQWHPRGPKSRVVTPPVEKAFPWPEPPMEQITPASVATAIDELLAEQQVE
jgi:ADP-heptose:LPS heptosyltransferase